MSTLEIHVREVIVALRVFERRIDEILGMLDGKRSISQREKLDLQALLVPLKADIKSAAKRGKVHDDREPQSSVERAYFDPSLRGASANFRVATNSHPITSRWHECLYDVRIDITYFLSQLETQYPRI